MANKGKDSAAEQRESFTGIVFVVLSTPQDQLKVLEKQDSAVFGKFKRTLFGCCYGSNESKWIFERAPEPTDINWENLKHGTMTRILSGIGVYIATGLLIMCCLGIIATIKQW